MSKNLIYILFLFPCLLIAQTGPGGVGNSASNGLWLSAHNLSLVDGSLVANWVDTSGNNNDAFQGSITDQPSFVASSLNDYPSINFNGTSDWLEIADASILDGTSSINYFAVVKPTSFTSPTTVHSIISKRDGFSSPASNYSYSFFFLSSNLTLDIATGNNRFNDGAATFSTGSEHILSFGFDGSKPSSSRSTISRDGQVLITGSETSTVLSDSPSPVVIGKLNVGDTRHLNAEVAEIIHFNKELNVTETVIVNNYLSAKYNIPIDPSVDFYTQDDPANGDFDHDVAGIGRANGTSFPSGLHLDSKGTGIVRISSTSSLGGDEYLFWGRETKSGIVPMFIDNPLAHEGILDTKWRVSEVGAIGSNLDFEIDLTGAIPAGTCYDYTLVIDNDSDFSTPSSVETLTLTGDIGVATTVDFNDGDYFTVIRDDRIVYDGTSWFNGSGPGNTPSNSDSCKDLYILSGPTVDLPGFHVRSISMTGNGRLRIDNNTILIVEEGIFIDAGSFINLRGRTQLIQNHIGTNPNTGDGFLRRRQQGTANRFNYNFWSSPVHVSGDWQLQYLRNNNDLILFSSFSERNPSVSDNPLTLSGRWLYTYNGARNDYSTWNYVGATGSILPGLGYTMKGSGIGTGSYTYRFEGTPNSGDISIPVTANGSVLVGNPYPSALDMNQFLSDNATSTTATAYFYEQFITNNSHSLIEYEGGYATRNLMMGTAATADASGLTSGLGTASKPAPEQFTAVAQGFFMDTTTGADIIFNNAQRDFVLETDSNGSVFYAAPGTSNPSYVLDTRTKITFSFSKPNAYVKYIGLGYDPRATHGVDNGFDAIDKNEEPDGMRWHIDQNEYIIQSLPQINTTDILPLQFQIGNAGDYTIAIDNGENVPLGMEIYLYDQFLDVEYALHNNAATLNLPVMNNETNRFSIRFLPTSTLSLGTESLEGIEVFHSNSVLEIINPTTFDVDTVSVYNINGQLVRRFKDSIAQMPLQLSSGIYVVKLDISNGLQLSEKILVQ